LASDWQERVRRADERAEQAGHDHSAAAQLRTRSRETFDRGADDLLRAAVDHYPDIRSATPSTRYAAKLQLAHHVIPGLARTMRRHLEHLTRLAESRFVRSTGGTGLIQPTWSEPDPAAQRARIAALATVVRGHYPDAAVTVRHVPAHTDAHPTLTTLPWEQHVIDIKHPDLD
jgi:hypothetical protein